MSPCPPNGSPSPGRTSVSIAPQDPRYPKGILALPAPPSALWVAGCLPPPGQPMIAIVGARAADGVGLESARLLAVALVERGCLVLSGGAMGIDAEAHRSAMDANGVTAAFFAGGLEDLGPKHNGDLYDRIVETGGCLLSAERPDVKPLPSYFPRRNRFIAAAAQAVVVVQARMGSGTMSTAQFALTLGKPLLVVPGGFGDQSRLGCAQLIRSGGHLIASTRHLHQTLDRLEGAGDSLPLMAALAQAKLNDPATLAPSANAMAPLSSITTSAPSASTAPPPASGKARRPAPALLRYPHDPAVCRVLEALGSDTSPVTIDCLLQKTGFSCWTILPVLTTLEMNGDIVSLGGGRYVAKWNQTR